MNVEEPPRISPDRQSPRASVFMGVPGEPAGEARPRDHESEPAEDDASDQPCVAEAEDLADPAPGRM